MMAIPWQLLLPQQDLPRVGVIDTEVADTITAHHLQEGVTEGVDIILVHKEHREEVVVLFLDTRVDLNFLLTHPRVTSPLFSSFTMQMKS
jgi:hypothetical protein